MHHMTYHFGVMFAYCAKTNLGEDEGSEGSFFHTALLFSYLTLFISFLIFLMGV